MLIFLLLQFYQLVSAQDKNEVAITINWTMPENNSNKMVSTTYTITKDSLVTEFSENLKLLRQSIKLDNNDSLTFKLLNTQRERWNEIEQKSLLICDSCCGVHVLLTNNNEKREFFIGCIFGGDNQSYTAIRGKLYARFKEIK